MNTYAAELDEDDVVARVIVGTAQWATDNLGGTWVDTEHKAGPGWTYDGTNIVPPPADLVAEAEAWAMGPSDEPS